LYGGKPTFDLFDQHFDIAAFNINVTESTRVEQDSFQLSIFIVESFGEFLEVDICLYAILLVNA
jgi:hypothetical protein